MPAGRGSHERIRRGERGEKGAEERAGPRKMPAGRESHKRNRRRKGRKRGQRRGPAQEKCPPVRESQEEPAWRREEKRPEERGGPKKMPAGEGVTRGAGVEKGRKRARGGGRPKKNTRR